MEEYVTCAWSERPHPLISRCKDPKLIESVATPVDAWKQYSELVEKFTTSTDVRTDISVTGRAWDRSVEVQLAKIDYTKDEFDLRRKTWFSSKPRNVSTMRELAYAILEACDFVDDNNPKWASNPKPPAIIPTKQGKEDES